MPTPHSVIAAVASGLSGIDPESADAVEAFYEKVLPLYSEKARELVLDWLVASVDDASANDVDTLIAAVRKLAQADGRIVDAAGADLHNLAH